MPNYYSFRYASQGNHCCPRNWILQGANQLTAEGPPNEAGTRRLVRTFVWPAIFAVVKSLDNALLQDSYPIFFLESFQGRKFCDKIANFFRILLSLLLCHKTELSSIQLQVFSTVINMSITGFDLSKMLPTLNDVISVAKTVKKPKTSPVQEPVRKLKHKKNFPFSNKQNKTKQNKKISIAPFCPINAH